MPDPQVLYIVAAVVALGLVGWVIVVLLRPDRKAEDDAHAPAAPPAVASSPGDPVLAEPAERPKPWLHSHAEITDEIADSSGAGARARPREETGQNDEPTAPAGRPKR